ncbi:unnamed protein product [Closterium sp. NIES-54]
MPRRFSVPSRLWSPSPFNSSLSSSCPVSSPRALQQCILAPSLRNTLALSLPLSLLSSYLPFPLPPLLPLSPSSPHPSPHPPLLPRPLSLQPLPPLAGWLHGQLKITHLSALPIVGYFALFPTPCFRVDFKISLIRPPSHSRSPLAVSHFQIPPSLPFFPLSMRQLLFSSGLSSIVPAAAGILAGALYRCNALGVRKAKVPDSIARFASTWIAPLLLWPSGSFSPSSAATAAQLQQRRRQQQQLRQQLQQQRAGHQHQHMPVSLEAT